MSSNMGLNLANKGFMLRFWQFFFLNRFVCDNCLKKTGRTRKENKFSAKSEFDISICIFIFHLLPAAPNRFFFFFFF